jgi:Pycsar effector protein
MTATTTLLAEQVASVRTELGRTDSKAGALLSLDAAGLAYLTTQASGRPVAVQLLLAAAGIALAAAAVILLVCVLRPRLGTTSFCDYAGQSGREILAALADRDLQHVRAEDLGVISEIAHRKFVRLRLAVDLTVAAVLLLAVSGLVSGVIA